MKKIILIIAINVCMLVSFGQKAYVRMKEEVKVFFNSDTVTLYKNEILEKSVEGKLVFFGEELIVPQDKTVDIRRNEIDSTLFVSIKLLALNDNYYKISKDADKKIYLVIDVTTERNNIPAIIIYPISGEKINLKTDNKIVRNFEDFSYKFIRISAADKNKNICVPTVFVDPKKLNLFTKDTIEFVDGKANLNDKINLKWKDLFTIENQEGVLYDSVSKDIILDLNKLKELRLKGIVQGTDLKFYSKIRNKIPPVNSEQTGKAKNPIRISLVYIIVSGFVFLLAGFAYYFFFVRKRNSKEDGSISDSPFTDDNSRTGSNSHTKINISEEQGTDVSGETLKRTDLSHLIIKNELSTLSSKADIRKLSENMEELKAILIKLQQDINKSGNTFKQENETLISEIRKKDFELKELSGRIDEYKKNEIDSKSTIRDLNFKLDSSIPKGVVYLGDCTSFIQPNERVINLLVECEKSLLSYIDSVKISSDSAVLRGMAGKFFIARPSVGIAEWMGIVENLRMNGLIVHSIKNDLIKETDKSVIVEILNHKLYERVYKKYIGALILFIEEIRTANVVGLSSKPSMDLQAKVLEICTATKGIGCKVVYLPLFEKISNLDFNNIDIEEDRKLASKYSQYPTDTVIEVISYAVNREADNISKSKVILK